MRTLQVPREDQCALFGAALKRFFGDFDEIHLTRILSTVDWVEYAAGELVMQEGTPASHVFFVVSGRLRAFAHTPQGKTRLLGEMGRGEAIGEIALITGAPRTATVIAIRPSLLVRLSKAVFEELLAEHPSISMRFAGLIIERLHRANAAKPLRDRPTSIALVSLAPAVDVHSVAEALGLALSASKRTALVTARVFQERFGSAIAHSQRFDDAELQFKVTRWLDELEGEQGYLLLAADELSGLWTQSCIRHADEVLLLADPVLKPEDASAASAFVERLRADCLAAKRLVFVHAADTARPRNTAAWLDKVDAVGHLHLRMGSASDAARLARIVSRSAVGLVLSGGGARGYAHLGVYKALRELDTPIDFVAGTSVGAAAGALIALEMSPDEALQGFRRVFNSRLALDFNFLPLVSFLSGRRLKNELERIFTGADGAAIHIEDAWRTFFCMASSYSHAREVVLRQGRMDKLVRASLTMPVFLPPVIHNSEVLLDGALMNNLPTEEMSRLEVGTIIAVDLWRPRFGRAQSDEVPSTWRLVADLFSRGLRSSRVPYLIDVLYNAPTLSSAARQFECARLADVHIQPELGDIGMMEWGAADRAVEAGYVAARSKLLSVDVKARLREAHAPNAAPASAQSIRLTTPANAA